jgi:hypothetical protein
MRATGRTLYEVECRDRHGNLPPEQELFILANSLGQAEQKGARLLKSRYKIRFRVFGVKEIGIIDAE